MAIIYAHGSFLFFVYVCAACLLGIFGIADTGLTVFWKNLFTVAFEILVGAGVTIFFIDRLNDYRATESLKRQLIREAGSRSNDIALSAVDQLRDKEWLVGSNGLLKGLKLLDAELGKANLENANLEGVNFARATLSNAKLTRANLREANLNLVTLRWTLLNGADLERARLGAYMDHADLSYANLKYADIDEAELLHGCVQVSDLSFARIIDSDMHETDFLGSIFHNTIFENVNLAGARFLAADLLGAELINVRLEDAIMPDDVKYSSEIDLKRYTCHEHREYQAVRRKINEIRAEWQIRPLDDEM